MVVCPKQAMPGRCCQSHDVLQSSGFVMQHSTLAYPGSMHCLHCLRACVMICRRRYLYILSRAYTRARNRWGTALCKESIALPAQTGPIDCQHKQGGLLTLLSVQPFTTGGTGITIPCTWTHVPIPGPC